MANKCKGFFIELHVDQRTVFSCVTSRVDLDSFQKIWAVAGERLYALAEEKMKQDMPLRYGEIRMTPVFD